MPATFRRYQPMRYALLIVDRESARPSPEPTSPEEQAQIMKEYNEYTEMLRDRPTWEEKTTRLDGADEPGHRGVDPVLLEDGRTIITDGPFIEAKEALGGFYLIEANDLDEALQLAAACPGAKFGAIEVRPIWEIPDTPEALAVGEGAAQPA